MRSGTGTIEYRLRELTYKVRGAARGPDVLEHGVDQDVSIARGRRLQEAVLDADHLRTRDHTG